MIHGIGPGVGQTTLGLGLERELNIVDFICEDEAMFERPEFAIVGKQFRRHNAGELGVPHPPRFMLEEAYRALVDNLKRSDALGLMDWSFVDLAEDLDWAEASLEDLNEHSRVVREIMSPLNPIVLYLGGDISVGIMRREKERGREWFGVSGLTDEEWAVVVEERVTELTLRHERCLGTFEAGGWKVAFLDGERTQSQVLLQALDAFSVSE